MKIKLLFAIVLTFALVMLLEQCKHDPSYTPKGNNLDTATHKPIDTVVVNTGLSSNYVKGGGKFSPFVGSLTGDSICFNTQIFPLISSTCNLSGCHDAITHKSGYNFTTYANIRYYVAKIRSTTTSNSMPRGIPAWTATQKALFQQWINEGSRDVECSNSNCDSSNVTYSTQIQGIMVTYCQGCHNPSSAGGGVLLDTYANTKNAGLNGHLICSVEWTNGCKNMPQNAPQLQICERRKIAKWVAAGCPQ